MTIKIKVTQERFEEIISIDDMLHLGELTRKEMYDYMVQFVVNENGAYVPIEEARKLFKKIPAKELSNTITQFLKAVSEAFVDPQREGTLEGQSSQEQEPLQNG